MLFMPPPPRPRPLPPGATAEEVARHNRLTEIYLRERAETDRTNRLSLALMVVMLGSVALFAVGLFAYCVWVSFGLKGFLIAGTCAGLFAVAVQEVYRRLD